MSDITFSEFLNYVTITGPDGSSQPLPEDLKREAERFYEFLTNPNNIGFIRVKKRRLGNNFCMSKVKKYLTSQGIKYKEIKK